MKLHEYTYFKPKSKKEIKKLLKKKNYWNDLGMQLLRNIIYRNEIYYPPELRNKVEYHIKKNGQVILRKKKKKKK